MASIYLIRHGQASFGHDDYDQLSDLGMAQAKLLGTSLAQKMAQPTKVITGTMLRHQQTAQQALLAFQTGNEPLANRKHLAGSEHVTASEHVTTSEHLLAQNHSAFSVEQDACWNEYAHQEILGAYDERFATPAGIRAFLKSSEHPEKQFLSLFNQAVARWMSGEFDADYSETWAGFKGRLQQGLSALLSSLESKDEVLVFTSGGPISYLAQSYLGVPETQLMQMNWTLINCGVTKLIQSRQGVLVASLNEHSVFEKPHNRHLISYK